MLKTRIAVLVSGGGTNLQALINAQKDGIIKSGEIALVLSSNPSAFALSRAEEHSIPAAIVSKASCKDQADFEEKIKKVLSSHDIDMIVLAGFMCILSADFTNEYKNRIINVHPSLIPSFCGEGFYGLRVHRAALDYGVKITGATVHYVNEIPDGGKIILQKAVKVLKSDTPESLQARVMRHAEWIILPQATETVAKKILRLKKQGGKKN